MHLFIYYFKGNSFLIKIRAWMSIIFNLVLSIILFKEFDKKINEYEIKNKLLIITSGII